MRRREFISLVGGAAAWPVQTLGQQPKALPVVSYLGVASPQSHLLDALLRGLAEEGFVEHKNVLVRLDRTMLGEYKELSAAAVEIVRQGVSVIFAGSDVAGLAAKAATSSIPIVFVSAADPVQAGLVDNLSRPSGNVTGVSFFAVALEQKRVEILRELAPAIRRLGAIVNTSLPYTRFQVDELRKGAASLGLELLVSGATREGEIEQAFSLLIAREVEAIIVGSDPFLFWHRDQIAALAARYGRPAIYNERRYAEAGGLMSYGTDVPSAFRQAGNYVGRILAGTKPGDLPVLLPTRFQLVINLKTARTLGVKLPNSILVRADEVIE